MYLQIKQLTKSYGAKRVVDNVDLTMEEGEVLSLLGPSGCGKTTILRMLAGLITPDSGMIQVGNRIFYDQKRELAVEDRQIGMVFQDYALWPHMTVANNIAFGMRLRRKPATCIKHKVGELLELVNLPGVEHRYPYELSGGQQQRVALARTLATDPRVVLLDEPLSSLDAGLRESMRTELVQLFHRLKITAINVTHDQDEAMSMSDRILVLRDGLVQQVGTPTDLYMHPANPFVASFMGHANMLAGEILRIDAATNTILLRLENSSSGADAEGKQVLVGVSNTNTRDHLHGKARLMCRPETIRVHQQNRQFEHANIIEGKVSHTSFVGGQWRTLIALEQFHAASVLAFPTFQPRLEQHLWLEFPPAHCQVIPE